jgi:transcriptional regulator with PAS, ATPase and Fis domain
VKFLLPIEKLAPILDVLPQALEVADSQGTIIYINKSFVQLTGIFQENRINKNIVCISPDSALAQVIINKHEVTNYHTFISNNTVAVIANAYPLMINNTLHGAIEILQPLSEQIMTLDEMEKIMIKRALDTYGRSMQGKQLTAKTLNISLATLYNKIKKYKI